MRRSSFRKILKIMSPDDRARVFEANPRAGHPRIAVGISEINLATKEDIAVIRTPCHQNQCADENDFRQEREAPPHAPFKSAFRIPQSEFSSNAFASYHVEFAMFYFLIAAGAVAQRLEQGNS